MHCSAFEILPILEQKTYCQCCKSIITRHQSNPGWRAHPAPRFSKTAAISQHIYALLRYAVKCGAIRSFRYVCAYIAYPVTDPSRRMSDALINLFTSTFSLISRCIYFANCKKQTEVPYGMTTPMCWSGCCTSEARLPREESRGQTTSYFCG